MRGKLRGRVRRVLVTLALLVLLLVGGVRALLPGWLRGLAEQYGVAALAGHVSVEDVELSVLRGHVFVHGVALSPEDGGEPLMVADRLFANLHWWPLVGLRIHLEELRLEHLQVSLELDETGTLSLLSLFATQAAPDPAPPEGEAGEPLFIVIDRIAVDETELAFHDVRGKGFPPARARLGEFALRGLAMEIPSSEAPVAWSVEAVEASGWRGRLGEKEQHELQLDMRGGAERIASGGSPSPFRLSVEGSAGKVEIEGEARVQPPFLEATLSWEGLRLDNYWVHFDQMSQGTLASGSSEGSLDIRLGGEEMEPLVVLVAGGVALSDVALVVPGTPPVPASWQSVEVDIAALRWPLAAGQDEATASPSIHLARVAVKSPEIALERTPAGAVEGSAAGAAGTPGAGSSADADPAAGAGANADAPEPSEPIALLIDELAIRDGRVILVDETVEGGFRYTVTDFDLSSQNMRWPERHYAAFELASGPDEARWLQLESQRDQAGGAWKLVLSNLFLLPFDPYFREFTDYGVTRGSLHMDMDGKLEGERYEGDMRLRFAGLRVESAGSGGEESTFEGVFGVPLDVALSLLRNRRGDVTLDAPFKGNAEGGRVPIGPAVVSASRRSLVNALAKPLTLVAGVLIPAGPDSEMTVSLLPFTPGNAGLSRYGVDCLDNTAAPLGRNDRLYANLFARITGADASAVAEAAGLEVGGGKAPKEGTPLHQALGVLASQRVSSVVEHLRSQYGVPQERITVLEWDGDVERAPGGVQLGLSQGKVATGPLRGVRRLVPGI